MKQQLVLQVSFTTCSEKFEHHKYLLVKGRITYSQPPKNICLHKQWPIKNWFGWRLTVQQYFPVQIGKFSLLSCLLLFTKTCVDIGEMTFRVRWKKVLFRKTKISHKRVEGKNGIFFIDKENFIFFFSIEESFRAINQASCFFRSSTMWVAVVVVVKVPHV